MTISKEFIVRLRDKEYPLFAGVLDAAHKAGLRSLTTRIIQIPTPENGHMAVVMARAEFEDGRVFEDVGDCSPANTSPQIATAALRMASTRAKGRVLRDAVNVGQTLLEELPDLDEEIGRHDTVPAGPANGRGRYPSETPRAGAGGRSVVAESPAPPPAARRTPEAGAAPRAARPVPAPSAAEPAETQREAREVTEPMVCSTATCGKPLTRGQYEVSLRAYGQPLCPACQKAAAAKG